MGEEVTKTLATELRLDDNDLLLFSYGDKESAQLIMGKTRVAMRQNMEVRGIYKPDPTFKLCWVIDFPLFCEGETPGSLESVHHPFTAPHPQDYHLLSSRTNLTEIRSLAYDLVLNGQEIGGGSIRIHDAVMQQVIIDEMLKLKVEEFEHMLDALRSGCPPHGGIALGIDRLIALICSVDSIRDVIAFPKGAEGKDYLSKAPVPITNTEKELYNIDVKVHNKVSKEKSDASDESTTTEKVKVMQP